MFKEHLFSISGWDDVSQGCFFVSRLDEMVSGRLLSNFDGERLEIIWPCACTGTREGTLMVREILARAQPAWQISRPAACLKVSEINVRKPILSWSTRYRKCLKGQPDGIIDHINRTLNKRSMQANSKYFVHDEIF